MDLGISSFVLGYLFKALVAAIIAEILTRPIARRIKTWLCEQPSIKHYLEDHDGASHSCQTCNVPSQPA